MPPVLDPGLSKVDGLAFLGLSLARKDPKGHPDSQTHQVAFDLNEVQDRDYEHVFSTGDDGWLVGGGEPGRPLSYKLPAPDSAHVEIMRIGTYEAAWGGIPAKTIIEDIKAGKILIPEVTVVPTAVVLNGHSPPDIEIRFDMEAAINWDPAVNPLPPLPVNWQLRFIHNQLFRLYNFPSRFCPHPFHAKIAQKVEFRSHKAREAYFSKCNAAVRRWRKRGPQALMTPDESQLTISPDIVRVRCPNKALLGGEIGSSEQYKSGIWLFTDRAQITHYFYPNFLPPYDSPEKRKIITDVLMAEWDEQALGWRKAPSLPKPVAIRRPQNKKSSNGNSFLCGVDADKLCGMDKM